MDVDVDVDMDATMTMTLTPGTADADKEWDVLNNGADMTNWEVLMATGGSSSGTGGGGSEVTPSTRWERQSLYQKFDPLVTDTPSNKIHCDPPPDYSFVCPETHETDGIGGDGALDQTVVLASNNDGSPNSRMNNCEPNLLPLIPDISPPPPPPRQTTNTHRMSMNMNNNFESPEQNSFSNPPQTPPHQSSPPPPPPTPRSAKNQNQNQNCEPELDSTFSRVLAEYEKTMSGYIQQIDELKEKLEGADDEKLKIIRERDLALEDLRNVESAFSDVHGKYERAKGLLENCRRNEEILKRRDQEMTEKIAHRDARIETLKEKLQSSLEQMHTTYEGRLKEMEMEASRQRVLIKKADLKVETLQNDVEHKSREISKLSGLCDELINGGVH